MIPADPSADPDKFVNLMMVDELGLDKWDPQDLKGMWKQGAITMCSFWFFGGIPVITYAAISAAGVDSQNLIFLIDCIVTLLTMFLLGAAKAKVHGALYCGTECGAPFSHAFLACPFTPRQVTNTSMFIQGGVMMINGTVACAASYLIAWAVKELMGDLQMCAGRGAR